MIIVASHAFDQFYKASATIFIPILLILQLLFEECRLLTGSSQTACDRLRPNGLPQT